MWLDEAGLLPARRHRQFLSRSIQFTSRQHSESHSREMIADDFRRNALVTPRCVQTPNCYHNAICRNWNFEKRDQSLYFLYIIFTVRILTLCTSATLIDFTRHDSSEQFYTHLYNEQIIVFTR